MKPSWDEQRRNEPRTDRKFRAEDQHLAAQDKEHVAKINHGDKLDVNPDARQEDKGDQGDSDEG